MRNACFDKAEARRGGGSVFMAQGALVEHIPNVSAPFLPDTLPVVIFVVVIKVTEYVPPTRDGEIEQWRVVYAGGECEDFESFEVRSCVRGGAS